MDRPLSRAGAHSGPSTLALTDPAVFSDRDGRVQALAEPVPQPAGGLADRFPIHVVCQWLGNTQAVAASHYLQTTDAHFEAAIQGSEDPQHSAAEMPSNAIIAAPRKSNNPCKTGVLEAKSSGGGTRTHDTRLMKPLL